MNSDTFWNFSKRGNALIGQEMFKILDRVKEFERAGEHVCHLELGEPRIVPPEEIIAETIKGLQEKKVGYCSPAGLLELREKIAEYYSNPSRNIEVSNVAISPANLLISQFLDIVCDRGDRIALFPPLFPTYFAACNHIGLDTQYVPLSQENGFQLTEDHADKALAYKPKAIIVNSGNNPTGAIYDKEVLTYLVNKCEEFGYWLLSDETYSKLNFKKDYFSLVDFEFPKLVIISSFSKIFAIPGFRTGFVIADPRVIDKVTLSSSTLYSCLPIFVQLGACRGVDLFDAFAKEGRPGPVWVDIPLNFQLTAIDPDTLPGFNPSEIEQYSPPRHSVEEWCQQCYTLLANSRRPLLLAGYGIRLAHAEEEFRQLLETLQIPFVSSWTASDLVPTNHPLYTGRPGVIGQRGANLAVQNCDLLMSIGSHLSIPLTGTLFDAFAREAKIVMVDIDRNELEFETVRVDLRIWCDAKLFLQGMLRVVPRSRLGAIGWWRDKCSHYKKYNSVPDEWRKQKEYFNPYVFIDTVSNEVSSEEVIVVDGGGTNLFTSFQAFKVQDGQRLTLSSGICAMGTGLPESIGACFANDMKRTICLSGDGGLQLNIQELQTIVHHKLPIKIFVMNNAGYLAIRHTQDAFLEGNYVGSTENGGLSLPDFLKVAAAYGLKTTRVNNHSQLQEKIRWTLREPDAVLCEVMVSPDQQLIPQQGFDRNPDGTSSPRPLEDMYPYLDRKEFHENMIVKPVEASLK